MSEGTLGTLQGAPNYGRLQNQVPFQSRSPWPESTRARLCGVLALQTTAPPPPRAGEGPSERAVNGAAPTGRSRGSTPLSGQGGEPTR